MIGFCEVTIELEIYTTEAISVVLMNCGESIFDKWKVRETCALAGSVIMSSDGLSLITPHTNCIGSVNKCIAI